MYKRQTAQAPFRKPHLRTIFHNHGGHQAAISFFDIDLDVYRRDAALPREDRVLKSYPASFDRKL